MWRSRRYDNDIAFREVVRLAALDVRSQKLVRPADLSTDHLSSSDESSLARGHVEDVGLLFMHFNLSCGGAAIHGNRIAGFSHQRAAFGHFVMVEVSDSSGPGSCGTKYDCA